MKAYLSGGMEHASNRGAEWRSSIESWLMQFLSHESFNPVRVSDEFLRARYPGLDQRRMKTNDLAGFKALVGHLIEIDLTAIERECDYCICYWDQSAQDGAGTKGEVTLAKYLGKPVYLVSDMPFAEIPGWVLGCSTETFRSFDELKSFLRTSFRKAATE